MKTTYLRKDEIYVGMVVKNNSRGPYEVISIDYLPDSKVFDKSSITIKFINTGYVKTIKTKSLQAHPNSIKDPYYPSIFGIGWLGEGEYVSRIGDSKKKTPQYRCWENMLARVYTEHRLTNRYEGRGVTVCEEWKDYQIFGKWFDENYRESFVLDKDILCHGNKIYSPEFCVFIPQELNKFFTTANKRRGKYPVGVCETARGSRKKYMARVDCSSFGGRVATYYSDSVNEAFEFYREHKEKLLHKLADKLLLEDKITEVVHDKLMKWEAVPFPD